MKYGWLYILMAYTHCSTLMAQEHPIIMESLSMASEILNQEIKYSVILPEDYYSSSTSYPVVFLLHGLGGTEGSWLEYGRVSQTAFHLVERREIIPMIYVMPQGFKTYYVNDFYGKFPYQDMFIQELVPLIDKQFRTIPDKYHRATMGYSMGGFGALVLPLENGDVFSTSVALSISIRTDEQYMTEDASGWDEQWGRLFGGVGLVGEDRLTDYYQQHSPFHLLNSENISRHQELKIYIDNGDDEQTLCASNEELHMQLRDLDFPHEYRVRDGGHEFSYWREAMPNGLRFISDAFEGEVYRGEKNIPPKVINSKKVFLKKENGYQICVPDDFYQSTRLYPTLYFVSNMGVEEKGNLAQYIKQEIEERRLPPIHVVFLADQTSRSIDEIISEIERNYRGRSGYRFRAVMSYENIDFTTLSMMLNESEFTVALMLNGALDSRWFKEKLNDNESEKLKRSWWFFATYDESDYFEDYGRIHIMMRNAGLYHEYRVSDSGADGWLLDQLPEALSFLQLKLHW